MSRTAIFATIAVLLGCLFFGSRSDSLCAQHPGYPGAPVRNYYQPVKIRGSQGTRIAMAFDGRFVERNVMPHAVGLLVGEDYRLRITDIPFHPGREVFPSVTVIARTYPPQGLELEYPILIDITQEDLELALDGKFVTRVIYLEDPKTAMPIRGDLGLQVSTEADAGTDPIDLAATLGQPVAIIRIGGRVPNNLGNANPTFFHGSPSWAIFDKTPTGQYEVVLYQKFQNLPLPYQHARQPSAYAAVPTYPLPQASPQTLLQQPTPQQYSPYQQAPYGYSANPYGQPYQSAPRTGGWQRGLLR